jgi:isopentenyldiphosphate isomerase
MVYGPMDNMVVEVYQGRHDALPTRVDTQEVAQVGFASVRELMDHENSVTPWLREILKWRTGRQNLLTIL